MTEKRPKLLNAIKVHFFVIILSIQQSGLRNGEKYHIFDCMIVVNKH